MPSGHEEVEGLVGFSTKLSRVPCLFKYCASVTFKRVFKKIERDRTVPIFTDCCVLGHYSHIIYHSKSDVSLVIPKRPGICYRI